MTEGNKSNISPHTSQKHRQQADVARVNGSHGMLVSGAEKAGPAWRCQGACGVNGVFDIEAKRLRLCIAVLNRKQRTKGEREHPRIISHTEEKRPQPHIGALRIASLDPGWGISVPRRVSIKMKKCS